MIYKALIAAAAAAISIAGVVNAATVTQLIHFDDAANNGLPNYTTSDGNFYFDPTNLQSGNCADSTNGGNGSCLIEENQGYLTTMTRLTGDMTFDLDGFYFHLTGNGQASGNFITATADNDSNKALTFMLGQTYANVFDYDTGLAAGALVHNGQYIADTSGFAGFSGVSEIDFTSLTSGQNRLDCVVATFDGATTDAYDPATSCGLNQPPTVPLPASALLLFGAIGGLSMMRRRKA